MYLLAISVMVYYISYASKNKIKDPAYHTYNGWKLWVKGDKQQREIQVCQTLNRHVLSLELF